MKTLKTTLAAVAFALAIGGAGMSTASAAQENPNGPYYNGGQGHQYGNRWGHSRSYRYDNRSYRHNNRQLNRRYNRRNRHRDNDVYFNFGPNGFYFGFGR